MAKGVVIPPIPTKETHFEKGNLKFKILEGCAYCPDVPGFSGGDWVYAKLRTMENDPAFVRLDGGELVIEKLTDYLVDDFGNYVAGKYIELARLRVCD